MAEAAEKTTNTTKAAPKAPAKTATKAPAKTTVKNEKTSWQRLAAFLTDLSAVAKNKKNPHFKSTYSDINAVISEINTAMSNHDIIVTQEVIALDETKNDMGEPITIPGYDFGFLVRTRVRDTISGDVMLESLYPIISKDIRDPQKVGGANTYARRYSLLTTLMLQSDDDDGNSAASAPKTPAAKAAPSKSALIKEVQTKFTIKAPEDLEALTTKVLGESKASKTFQTLRVEDLTKILESEDGAAPF